MKKSVETITTAETRQAQKNLLAENRKALQFLHCAIGFDFCKPYTIIEGSGRFTLNTLEKSYTERGISTDNCEAVLFIKDNRRWYNDNIHVVRVGGFIRFNIEKLPHLYKYNIDYYFTKTDFEKARKNYAEKFFLVVQSKVYVGNPIDEYKLDFTERMTLINSIKWTNMSHTEGGFSSGIFKQGNQTVSLTQHLNIDDPLDKSGYWIADKKDYYARRVKVIKANKARAAAEKYNCTEETKDIESKVEELKQRIIQLIQCGENSRVSRVFYKYEWLCRDLKIHKQSIAENSYPSITAIKNKLDGMNNDYINIIKLINA